MLVVCTAAPAPSLSLTTIIPSITSLPLSFHSDNPLPFVLEGLHSPPLGDAPSIGGSHWDWGPPLLLPFKIGDTPLPASPALTSTLYGNYDTVSFITTCRMLSHNFVTPGQAQAEVYSIATNSNTLW